MTAATDTALQVSPLSGWTGALITGVDISAPLADEELAAIKTALHKWKVVFFRDQSLDQCQGLLESDGERHEYAVVPPHRALALIDQVPQSKVEKARGARLHAVNRAALDAQAELREQRSQPLRLVPPAMADEIVECRPVRLMQWN